MAEEARKKLSDMLIRSLAIEHSAIQQYELHITRLKGVESPVIAARLSEITGDEWQHANKFRDLVSDYLDVTLPAGQDLFAFQPSPANTMQKILEDNLVREHEGIDLYLVILKEIRTQMHHSPSILPYGLEVLEQELRHIIIDEQEHVVELTRLLPF